ncbi:sugar phosphate isomerase/epimerase [Paenibacillus sp. N3.4]|uniref:sugar phosphate isomerase/epimerase family protein n=1 Tax=Paenibacillus sp. N3.4 TaxID=2603222 RepID=UPI00164FDCC3|nr:sugar phosphate isomerase/epimerase [Paenibacillus sp. N3.4]
MNYSLCSISFRHELVSFNDLVHFACEKGFAGIELWGIHARALSCNPKHEVSRLLDKMEARGVRISMVSDYIDLFAEDDQTSAVLERGNSLFSLAQTFRTNKLRIFAGNQSSDVASPRVWERCVTRLQELAQLASENGVYLVLETHPNTLADTLSSTLRLLNEAAHSHIRVNLDFLHIWELGSDPLYAYRALKGWTINYHLKNISGRDKLGVFAPDNVYSPSGDRNGLTALSEGVIDYTPIIEQLDRDNSTYTAAIEWFGDQPFRYLEKELAWLIKHELQRDVSI